VAKKTKNIILLLLLLTTNLCFAQNKNEYTNPIIHADFSDPDAIRVGEDYYMVTSSFTGVPGLPILHSTDLVHWTIVNYALQKLIPENHFDTIQHGGGVWAPSIRYHNNEFYIFYPDPDYGIYVTKAKKVTDKWSTPILVEAGKGLIDPCPFWDDDGKVYLAHAYAGSRAGVKSILVVKELDATATKVISHTVMVYDGHNDDPTIEGPKMYKRNNYYYIFAPGGGVSTGWQTVLRSKNIYGPYERKIVLEQGASKVNGPHQGAWVTTPNNENWFLHFQDKGTYGRIVHLQPMQWKNDWPIIGIDKNGNGIGEPVSNYNIPFAKNKSNYNFLQTSDDFNEPKLGLQWQWQANPKNNWAFTTTNGFLRMFSIYKKDSSANLWNSPNLLMQKFPAENFTATVKFDFNLLHQNEKFGLIIFGLDYACLSIQKKKDGNYIIYSECKNADKQIPETETIIEIIENKTLFLKSSISTNAICKFAFSIDGKNFKEINKSFTAKEGKWVGAKIGLFAIRNNVTNDAGFVDVDWFKIIENENK
jgi:beta-xylosidase